MEQPHQAHNYHTPDVACWRQSPYLLPPRHRCRATLYRVERISSDDVSDFTAKIERICDRGDVGGLPAMRVCSSSATGNSLDLLHSSTHIAFFQIMEGCVMCGV